MNGEMPYKERLSSLNILPLSYDRELKYLTFFYKALFGFINVNLSNYMSFVSHGRTLLSLSSEYILQNPLCKTTTFQSYYTTVLSISGTLYLKKYLLTVSLDLVLLNVISSTNIQS
jgi:hypothetical protein